MKTNPVLITIVFLSIFGSLIFNACSKTISDENLFDRHWTLTEMEDQNDEYEPIEEIYIEFTEAETSGSGGCNAYWITYTRNEKEIEVTGLSATEKYCDNGISDLEEIYFNLLNNASSLEIRGDELTIYCDNGELEFEAN